MAKVVVCGWHLAIKILKYIKSSSINSQTIKFTLLLMWEMFDILKSVLLYVPINQSFMKTQIKRLISQG